MEDFTITATPGYATTNPNAAVETFWGVTRDQANGAQPILFNAGDKPLTITIPPMTGVFARIKEKTQ